MRDVILTGLAWVVLATGAGMWVYVVTDAHGASIARAHGRR